MSSRLSLVAALLLVTGHSLADDPKEIRRETDPDGAVRVRFICGNRATDERLALLPQYPDIEEVQAFGSAGFSDAGVAHIAALPHLKSVSLGGLHLTPKALAHFRGKESLQELVITQLPLTNDLANAIAAIPNLEMLRLQLTSVEPGAWEKIAQLPKLRVLSLGNTLATASPEDLNGLEHFTRLEKLSLVGQSYNHDSLAKLVGNSGLKELSFTYINLTDDLAAHLSKLPELEALTINHASVSPTAFAALKPLGKLRYFACHSIYFRDEGLLALKCLPQLKEIETSGEHVTEAATHQLRAAMHNTVVNKFRWKYSIADLRAIAHKVELDSLGEVVGVRMLCHNQATDAKLAILQQFPKLERLELCANRDLTDEGLERLATLPKLRHLFVMSDQVTDAGLKYLARQSSLETIDLSTPSVTKAGVAELQKQLPQVTVTQEE